MDTGSDIESVTIKMKSGFGSGKLPVTVSCECSFYSVFSLAVLKYCLYVGSV